MDCKQCIENLTAYQDGELGGRAAKRMQSHLAVCQECAEELRSLSEAANLIDAHIHKLELRPESWNAVKAKISTYQDATSPWQHLMMGRWRIAAAAFAIMVALILGYTQYRQIQRRNLERYIAQYIEEREAYRHAQPVSTDLGTDSYVRNPYIQNPFLEVRPVSFANPFRTEDR